MRKLIRLFFRTLRSLLGPVMLVWERLSTPRGLVRSPEDQAHIDKITTNLALYQYKTCPFCIRVRKQIARLSLRIETRDAQTDSRYRDELLRHGGQVKVPCLRIAAADGQVQWLYESAAINSYLENIVL